MPKKEGIRELFDDIAVKYDRFNHVSSFGADRSWRRKAVRQIADTKQPIQVLDVATGTADFALAVNRKAAPGSHVTGIDLSQGMLDVGRKKCQGLPIDLEVGDAENLRFADNTFDRVCVAFGVRNFENLMKGLKEMLRVLKPGGRLVILELSYPKNRFIFSLYKFYSLRILPKIGAGMTGNTGAFTYLPDSILKFPLPEKFIPMLKEAGYSTVKARAFLFGVCRMYCAEK
ncbi:MAG: bifunctional demethylmenaquinone methyltransferase/2-methoxy-6-polyprenyl-1,4-benzoquinol methylase UbiE [Bacteroidaceae bacterium]|nr:bifunctional demethylmenaquinone methyltransferase/2-methoxy-6-polyprenyl-1,4-benzoquinol methylase UbiE [Bacteroidaceae bacterium]MBR4593568.1 bifunctional demethylmenaquinone methyltransferase/2-methoxy-6-polyprenyl-1,4-benzoquinol methylase UbiE [Bacteroidaceae bacterium]